MQSVLITGGAGFTAEFRACVGAARGPTTAWS